jgi:hypothetical protein
MSDARTQHLKRRLEVEARGVLRRVPTADSVTREQTLSQTDIVDCALFWVFIAGLAWVPYMNGSNGLEAWAINAAFFPGLAIVYEISLLVRGASHQVGLKTIRVSAALFVVVVIWILIQDTTWTPAFVHHPIWGMTANALSRPAEGSISVNRDLTTLALLRLLTAASVFWLAIQLCRNSSRSIQFMMAFVAISSGYAAYGLFAFAQSQSVNTSSPSHVTSTFYNQNHYATYAGMGFVVVLGLIARIYQRDMVMSGGALRFKIATFIDVTGQKAVLLLGSAFLLLVAIILTASRGGIIATGAGVIVWMALTFGRTERSAIARHVTIGFVSLLIAGVFVAFGSTFVGKMAEDGLEDSNRIGVYIITLRSIFAEPFLGYGYGTFADIFPMFRERSIEIQGAWEQAHNTYLEVLQGLGLIFGSMLVTSVALLVVNCCKGAMTRQQFAVPAIATGIAFVVGTHILFDFSVQMQAVALTLLAIMGAGVAQSVTSQLNVSD